MTIVPEFSDSADISVTFDFFEAEICKDEQEAEDKQIQADLLIKQANMALEQVGIKRQQQARALKALVEAKQALKEAMRLGLKLGEEAGPIIQREIAAELNITIAPPVVAQVDDLPVTAFLYPEGVAVPKTLTSLTPTGLEPDVLIALDKQVGYTPKPPEWAASLKPEVKSESPSLASKECEEDPFDLPCEPQKVVVRKVNSKVDIHKGVMGPVLISEDYPLLCRYQQHLQDKLGSTLGGYDTLLEDIGSDSCPKWQLLTSHLTDEQASILNKTEVDVPRVLTQKEKELNAYKKNVEAQKERILPFAESIGINTSQTTIEVGTPQLIELSHRMIYVSADPQSGAVEHCYIGGANEAGLRAWGKWLTLSPKIATHSEVGPATKIRKFKHELKLWGMSLAQLQVLKAEGMVAVPPREKTQASKDLGNKLLAAK